MSIKTSKLWITSIALTLTLAVAAQAQTGSSAAGTSSDSTALALPEAEKLVIGKWKVNWTETGKLPGVTVPPEAMKATMTFEFKNGHDENKKNEFTTGDELTKGEVLISANGQTTRLKYDLKGAEEGESLSDNEFFVTPGVTRHGKVEIQRMNRLIYTAFKGIPFPLVLDREVPATAKKLNINGGDFTFGFTTKLNKKFRAFTGEQNLPFPQDVNIKRLSDGPPDNWFSYAQNIGSAASDPIVTGKVHYPGIDEGSGVLHPGPKEGDIAIARFTADKSAEYEFHIETQLIHEMCKDVQVTIFVREQQLQQKSLTKHLVPWTLSFTEMLNKGDTVDIAVDSGEKDDHKADHVLVTADAAELSTPPTGK